MFRIQPYLKTARILLHRRHFLDHPVPCISTSPPLPYQYPHPQERKPCPPPPPPPKKPPADDSLFWGAIALVFLAGGFAVYAKKNPETRDWITIVAPWFDDVIAIIYQENMTYEEFVIKCLGDAKACVMKVLQQDVKPKNVGQEHELPPLEDQCGVCEELVEADEDICDRLKPPVIVTDICEVEKCLNNLGDAIIEDYKTAKDICCQYNKFVYDSNLKFTLTGLVEMEEMRANKLKVVEECLNNANENMKKFVSATIGGLLQEDNVVCAASTHAELFSVCQSLYSLSHGMAKYLDCGVKASKEEIANTHELVKEYRTKIKSSTIQFQWENDKSIAVDNQLTIVSNMVNQYVNENSTMFPDLNYESPRPALSGDPDLLLHHTLRYTRKLRKELDDAAVGMTERVTRAVENLPPCERDKAKQEIQKQYLKRKAELDRWFNSRLQDQKAANDKLLKELQQKQKEKHEETLKIRLVQKEAEANVKLNKLVAERVAHEKEMFARQLREMRNKLKVVEDKLNVRLKIERETRRSQALWSAGASLLAATKKGDELVRVDKELNAIEKASGDGDKLVLTVLKAIPKSVRQDGVVPESVLREKYHSMENVALSVAMVEQEGAPLPVYFMSWIQSILLFMKISGIPQDEIDKMPKEPPPGLDTFDLLQRARFWIERGNIGQALRYVNALEGASRAAATAWASAARDHLETRQAAEAVLAHAAALGLQYI